MAEALVAGDICKAQLSNTAAAYKVCVDDHHSALQWWQKPEFEIAGGVTISFLGFLTGITHCFGACK